MVMTTTRNTIALLGSFTDWNEKHIQTFKTELSKTGFICILLCNIPNEPIAQRRTLIENTLFENGYNYGQDYTIQIVPNITHVLQ